VSNLILHTSNLLLICIHLSISVWSCLRHLRSILIHLWVRLHSVYLRGRWLNNHPLVLGLYSWVHLRRKHTIVCHWRSTEILSWRNIRRNILVRNIVRSFIHFHGLLWLTFGFTLGKSWISFLEQSLISQVDIMIMLLFIVLCLAIFNVVHLLSLRFIGFIPLLFDILWQIFMCIINTRIHLINATIHVFWCY